MLDKNTVLFPHNEFRDNQEDIISIVKKAFESKKNLILNAPTGLGKTDTTLPLALSYALKNDLVVFFLTSKHTQHKIAIDSLKKIKEKYSKDFVTIDLIGKRWMCLQKGATILPSGQFLEYCKDLRENELCQYYSNLKHKGSISQNASLALDSLKSLSPLDVEHSIDISSNFKVCPYEISLMLAKDAKVVVADYYHIFNKPIRDKLLEKMEKTIEDCIIIVDEAHNLPSRIRALLSIDISTYSIQQAIKEAQQLKNDKLVEILQGLEESLEKLASQKIRHNNEALLLKADLIKEVDKLGYYQEIVDMLHESSEHILEEKRRSFLSTIANFLSFWLGEDHGFARIISKAKGKKSTYTSISYHCLDPSIAASEVINSSYSTILMSGTLSPIQMYKDTLGVDNTLFAEFSDPFPKDNRLTLVVPKTSTKYKERSDKMFEDIANLSSKIINPIPGNVLVFFPSYELRDKIFEYLKILANKTLLLEQPASSKEERSILLEKFKSYKDSGSILLAVSTGSFSEGIDLPGDYLKAVIIVGLPLTQPNLETSELIRYYDEKFQKGWDYGYIMPAIIKTLQAAGRCIRSESDRGIISFIDERYIWPNYSKCFPKDWELKVTIKPEELVKDFFSK